MIFTSPLCEVRPKSLMNGCCGGGTLPDGKVDQKKALEITLADLETLRDQAAAVRALADKDDVFGVANLMEDHIANYAKQIWFLRSMLA